MYDFSAELEKLADCEAILEYVYVTLLDAGASWVSYHFTPIFSAPNSLSSVIWVRGLTIEEESLYVREFREDDPVPTMTFAHGPILCWRDAEELGQSSEHARAHLAKLRERGIDNWVGFALYGPRDRDAFASVRFNREPGELEDGVLGWALSFLQSAHIRICLIIDAKEPSVTLSDREREVLNWIGRGKSSGDIATILNISAETVRTYTKRIYEKLDANDRVTATVRALKLGLVEL